MYKISKFECAKAPEVKQVLTLNKVLRIIKYGDENLPLIKTARDYGKGQSQYDNIKTKLLPTFRFNFLFNGSASNQNIISSTGLIYLDVDNTSSIPKSDYILASWKSLSETGFGILVKVDNLNLDNYSEIYDRLSTIIGINSDSGARKATQQTIMSYDPNLYYNPHSLIFHFIQSKKVSNLTIKKKREKCIGANDTSFAINSSTLRFNNIDEYFTNEYADTEYRLFDEKIMICSPFIPRITNQGNRNSRMFYLLSQYAMLNQNAGKSFLKAIAGTINKKMLPSISESEINSICDSILRKREEGSLSIFYNEERRLLFNPNIQLTTNEKMRIVNTELGQRKSQLTKESIYIILEGWDFDKNGKITQPKVAKLSGKSIATIKRHWNDFKDYASDLNKIKLTNQK